MSLIHNNLKDLQKENSISMKTIRSDQNRNEVTRMIQYLSSSHLSLFQIEVIQKDLIGIALEADREQMTMSEKLGISMKEFCDGIIQSTEEYPARREHIYQEVVTAVQYLFYLYAIEYIIFQSAPAHWGISIQLTVGLLVFLTLNRMTSLYIRNRLSLHPKAYMRSMYNVAMLAGFIIYVLITRLFLRHIHTLLFYGNGWLILSVLAFMALIATFSMNRYWNNCSQKYNY